MATNITLNSSNVTEVKYKKGSTTTDITEIKYKKGSNGTATSVWTKSIQPSGISCTCTVDDNDTYYTINMVFTSYSEDSVNVNIIGSGTALMCTSPENYYMPPTLLSFGTNTRITKSINVQKTAVHSSEFKIVYSGNTNTTKQQLTEEFPLEIVDYDVECPYIQNYNSDIVFYWTSTPGTQIVTQVSGAVNYDYYITLRYYQGSTYLGQSNLTYVSCGDTTEISKTFNTWYGDKDITVKICYVSCLDDNNIFIMDPYTYDEQFYDEYISPTVPCIDSYHQISAPNVTASIEETQVDLGQPVDTDAVCLTITNPSSNNEYGTLKYKIELLNGTATAHQDKGIVDSGNIAANGTKYYDSVYDFLFQLGNNYYEGFYYTVTLYLEGFLNTGVTTGTLGAWESSGESSTTTR